MTTDPDGAGRSLHESRIEAERWLPRLLDLSGPGLSQALERHPELQPGISQVLLNLADGVVHRHPARAYELTAAVVERVGQNMPLPLAWTAPYLRGEAWTAHAAALRGVRKPVEALAAVAVAFHVYRAARVTSWYIAVAEVVEAQILHDMDERAEALRQIRRAAEVILEHGASKRYAQVRMQESLMQWEAGHRTAAAQVWRDTARKASQRRDFELMATLHFNVGLFQLRHGKAGVAADHFSTAHGIFEQQGLSREAARALWGLAEVAARRGRLNDAISEYHKVKAVLLAHGDVLKAALASVELLKLLLTAGRGREVLPLADLFIRTFTEAEQENCVQAWTLVRNRADAGELAHEQIHRLRRFFRDLPLQPNARFA